MSELNQQDTTKQQSSAQPNDELAIADEAWAELSQDWQAQPTTKTDIAALVKRTKRRTQSAKVCFGLNIIATLGLFIAFLYGLYNGEWGEPLNTYLGFGSLLSVIFVYFEIKIRFVTWSQLCDSPEKAIDNAIAGGKSSMQYMWFTKLSLLPFLVLLNWFVYTVSEINDQALLPGFLMANGFLLVMYLGVDYLHRKRKKEYQQLLKMKQV